MEIRKATKNDIDCITKIYDGIHDGEEKGKTVIRGGFAAYTPP